MNIDVYTHTWLALRIFTLRAFDLHAAVRTSVVPSAFCAGVMLGIERAVGASLAFRLSSICGGDEFLARGALFD